MLWFSRKQYSSTVCAELATRIDIQCIVTAQRIGKNFHLFRRLCWNEQQYSGSNMRNLIIQKILLLQYVCLVPPFFSLFYCCPKVNKKLPTEGRGYTFSLSRLVSIIFSCSVVQKRSLTVYNYLRISFFLCPSWQPTRVCSALDTFEKSTPLTSLSMREDFSITRSMGEVILLFPSQIESINKYTIMSLLLFPFFAPYLKKKSQFQIVNSHFSVIKSMGN